MKAIPSRATIRPATTADVAAIFSVRQSVRENVLTLDELSQLGITPASIAQAIDESDCTWVATIDETVVGFSMVDLECGCLFAAFVLPEYEGLGIGTRLIGAAEAALFVSNEVAWLETAASSRAAGLYRHLGWTNQIDIGQGDIRLEKRRP